MERQLLLMDIGVDGYPVLFILQKLLNYPDPF